MKVNKWIIVGLLLTGLWLVNTLLGFRDQCQIFKNQVGNLDSTVVELNIKIQEGEQDVKNCQRSYDELLSEHNYVLDTLADCRNSLKVKFNPKKRNGETRKVTETFSSNTRK